MDNSESKVVGGIGGFQLGYPVGFTMAWEGEKREASALGHNFHGEASRARMV